MSIKHEDVWGPEDGHLYIRDTEQVASIIDGQHRLSGFNNDNSKDFDLIASIFVDLPVEDQAMLFATINIKQTKVNPSLVYDLFAETTLRSPQKSAHNICKSLNVDETSPFYHRIKPLGKKTEDYGGLITQATFVKALLPMICAQPDVIRDAIKKKTTLNTFDQQNAKCVFWTYFKEEKDWAILKVLTNYFNAIKAELPDDWTIDSSPLCRTIGFLALMRLLPELITIGSSQGNLDLHFFQGYAAKAKPLSPFSFEVYPANGPGQTKLYNALRSIMIE